MCAVFLLHIQHGKWFSDTCKLYAKCDTFDKKKKTEKNIEEIRNFEKKKQKDKKNYGEK